MLSLHHLLLSISNLQCCRVLLGRLHLIWVSPEFLCIGTHITRILLTITIPTWPLSHIGTPKCNTIWHPLRLMSLPYPRTLLSPLHRPNNNNLPLRCRYNIVISRPLLKRTPPCQCLQESLNSKHRMLEFLKHLRHLTLFFFIHNPPACFYGLE